MANALKHKPLYRLKVKSKKTGKWEFQLSGYSLKSMEWAVGFYWREFGTKTKIVRASPASKRLLLKKYPNLLTLSS